MAYPTLMLVVPGAVNTAFALLLVLSLGILASGWRHGSGREVAADARRASLPATWGWAFSLAMLALPVSIFLSQVANQRWGWPYYDAASRFLFSVPVFFALRRVAPKYLRPLQYGLIAGALVAAFAITYIARDWGNGRLGTSFLNPIHFGDLALTLGMLAAFSIDWGTRDTHWMRALKICALLAGLYASMKTGARGGWAAIPLFVALWLWFQRKSLPPSRLAWYAAAACVLAIASYLLLPEVHHRIDMIEANLAAYQGGQDNTSLGIRFQLWRAALLIFEQHPWLGVGMGGFKALMPAMQKAGVLTPLAAALGEGEVHSEMLSRLCQLGILGLAAIVSVYALPALMFARRPFRGSAFRIRSAQMGMVLIGVFFVYGLSVETFDLTMTAAFYALTTAILLASTHNENNS
ncbi:O-antigen ligase [Thiomonas sp. FB-Cd]|uniref:O-antigen ligase family protein n=1 Tax=Thiomonas sp. FB-Cd TaxID=1158292 RepID=UPI0009DCBCEB|nr:O-antigen ligase family protein [Thiomonas sp. FB-Cd]